jgi:hypothetical protein
MSRLPTLSSIASSKSHSNHNQQSMHGMNAYRGVRPVMYGEPAPHDAVIAKRRVESSICAFGGNLDRGKARPRPQTNKDAIFRVKPEPKESKANSTGDGGDDDKKIAVAQKKAKYEEALPNRYYENDSRLSWEFEESPPVEVSIEDDDEEEEMDMLKSDGSQLVGKSDLDSARDSKDYPDDQFCQSVGSDGGDAGSIDKKNPNKIRYRCKLCGQPKQNHQCPYQQSLARSIGIMVYPAVNAFTADEPGSIAAPLTEMNNFVDVQKEGNESSPLRPSPDRMGRHSVPSMAVSAQVTPESLRSNPRPLRPLSSLHSRKKRAYSQIKGTSKDQGDLLFVESMDLKPEQFRIVSQSKMLRSETAFSYPALPLPYAQRKRLSDNLFSLSNEVPNLTDECALVLREAREKDMWDLAVAELMTQVIVVIHCSDRDYRLEGLRQYLLTLGIAC